MAWTYKSRPRCRTSRAQRARPQKTCGVRARCLRRVISSSPSSPSTFCLMFHIQSCHCHHLIVQPVNLPDASISPQPIYPYAIPYTSVHLSLPMFLFFSLCCMRIVVSDRLYSPFKYQYHLQYSYNELHRSHFSPMCIIGHFPIPYAFPIKLISLWSYHVSLFSFCYVFDSRCIRFPLLSIGFLYLLSRFVPKKIRPRV